MREGFGGDQPSWMRVRELAELAGQAEHTLASTAQRIESLQRWRGQTSLLRFRERRRLDDLLAGAQAQFDRASERCRVAVAEHSSAAGELDGWLAGHAPAAARLVALSRELTDRHALDQAAAECQKALERTPEWPAIPHPARDLGVDRDFGP